MIQNSKITLLARKFVQDWFKNQGILSDNVKTPILIINSRK